MEWNNVKCITIPEGNVKKIIDSQGRTIWTKPEVQYQRLSYIHLDGNSYFDTGLSSKYLVDTYSDFNMQFIANIQNTSGNNIHFYGSYDTNLNCHGFGVDYSITYSNNTLIYYQGDKNAAGYVPNSDGSASEILNEDITYCSYYGRNISGNGGFMCTARPREITAAATLHPTNIDTTMYIGSCNGHPNVRNFIGNFIRFSIFSYIQPMTIPLDESKILIDIVPVIRLADNVCGMYNKQTMTFLPNIGTGTVTAGDLVDELFY